MPPPSLTLRSRKRAVKKLVWGRSGMCLCRSPSTVTSNADDDDDRMDSQTDERIREGLISGQWEKGFESAIHDQNTWPKCTYYSAKKY